MHGLNKGSRNGAAKLTEQQVRQIRARREAGERRCTLAQEYGVNPYAIRDITTGATWGWLD